MDVRIFDVSPFVYAGIKKSDILMGPLVKDQGKYMSLDIPCGGISFLFNQIYQHYQRDLLIFCCDRTPSIKQEIDCSYKASRYHDEDVMKQKQVAEIILRDCKFPVFAEDGYEADDFIYRLSVKYSKIADHVYVYSGDSDMYICVNDNVEIMPVKKTDKHITKANFAYTVKSGRNVPYNTLSWEKIIYGDTSDGIGPAMIPNPDDVYREFMQPGLYELLGDKTILDAIANKYPQLKHNIDLVFPLDPELPEFSYERVDKERIVHWANAMQHRYFPNKGAIPRGVQDIIDDMANNGLSAFR